MHCLWLKYTDFLFNYEGMESQFKKKKIVYPMLNGICPVSSEMGTSKSQIKQQEITPQIF